jgi:hypothetical protein
VRNELAKKQGKSRNKDTENIFHAKRIGIFFSPMFGKFLKIFAHILLRSNIAKLLFDGSRERDRERTS